MSVEKANEFLKALLKEKRSDETFAARVAKMKSKEEVNDFLSGMAREMGYADVSAEDIKQASAAEDERRRARTSAASEGLEALGDDELEAVAGGFYWIEKRAFTNSSGTQYTYTRKYDRCKGDFTDDYCHFSDACDWNTNVYFDCRTSYHGSPDDCTYAYFCDVLYNVDWF